MFDCTLSLEKKFAPEMITNQTMLQDWDNLFNRFQGHKSHCN